jgi:hypothetical protein
VNYLPEISRKLSFELGDYNTNTHEVINNHKNIIVNEAFPNPWNFTKINENLVRNIPLHENTK